LGLECFVKLPCKIAKNNIGGERPILRVSSDNVQITTTVRVKQEKAE